MLQQKIICNQVVPVLLFKDTATLYMCLVNNLRDYLKSYDRASKCIKIALPEPRVEIGSTKSKANLFAHYYNDITEHPNRQIRSSFRLGNNSSCVFSIKKSELHGNHFILMSTLTIVKLTISTTTDITLQTSVKKLRAITMCSAFTPDYGYDNSTIILFGDVYCPNTKCSGKLCLPKDFSISRQKRLSMSAMRVCVSGAQHSFWRSKKILLLVAWARGLHFWKEIKINSRCYWRCVLSCQELNKQKCESLDGYVLPRDPFLALESVEPSCLFTKFLL